MLTIALNWFYLLFTTFCVGFAVSMFSGKVFRYRLQRMDGILMAGLVAATVYAQVFSLFYRVNVEANLGLFVFCVVTICCWHRQMSDFLKRCFEESSLPARISVVVLFAVWCFFTSRGYMVLDSDLYHGQSIRWIEEYGVVKGLGNISGRFAYNSSLFAVSALYSMKFLLGRSLHCVNGFVAFLLSLSVMELGKCFRRRTMLLSDYARVAAAYYLTMIWDEVLAPSSDYTVMCTLFFILIRWLALLEQEGKKKEIAPYALLCVMGVYTLTLKLSGGLILLLVVRPAVLLLKEKRWKEIVSYLLLGLAVAVPWMTRTFLISGYLFYPFASLDLFSVDWKMDVGSVNTDAAQIKVWAKGAQNLGIYATVSQWFPGWFSNMLSATERLLVVGDLASCVLVAGMTLWTVVKKRWERLDVLLVLGTLVCCYLFWQFSAPMPRYGYAYVLLLAAVTAGDLLRGRRLAWVAYVFFLAYGAYKLNVGGHYIAGCCRLPYYVWQQTYQTYEVETFQIGGYTFYASAEGGCVGYEVFPAAPVVIDWVELRGEDLKDGFRLMETETNREE